MASPSATRSRRADSEVTCGDGPESRERRELLATLGRSPERKAAGAPLDWGDIGVLVQGLAFAPRTLEVATRSVTGRCSLGPRGAWILSLIDSGVCQPAQIALALRIGRSLVSVELARLVDAGLVSSTPVGDDRRRQSLALTAEGKAELDSVRATLEDTVRTALSKYTPEQVRLCSQLLDDLRRFHDARDSD